VTVLEKQSFPQRVPLLTASLIALVSSVIPSPSLDIRMEQLKLAEVTQWAFMHTLGSKVLDIAENRIPRRSQGRDTLVLHGFHPESRSIPSYNRGITVVNVLISSVYAINRGLCYWNRTSRGQRPEDDGEREKTGDMHFARSQVSSGLW
jgi:hypothetical protein